MASARVFLAFTFFLLCESKLFPFQQKRVRTRDYDATELPFKTDIRMGSHIRTSAMPENLARIGLKTANSLHRQPWLAGISKAFHSRINSKTGPFSSRQSSPKLEAQYAARNRSKPLLWMHVHKAGGTFMCILAQLAGEHVVEPSDSACNWLWHDQYRDSGRKDYRSTCEGRAAYMNKSQYTWAQIEREFSEGDRCWGSFEYATMLREPISLLESMMNYHPGCGFFGGPCGGGPQHPEKFLAELNKTLEKGRDAPPGSGGNDQMPLWKRFDNIQTRLLAPALDVPPGQINASHLTLAKKTLENFTVVARLEDLPKTGTKVFATLGWDLGLMSHVGEPVNAREHEFDFSPEEKAWLLDVNRYDLELWKSYAPR